MTWTVLPEPAAAALEAEEVVDEAEGVVDEAELELELELEPQAASVSDSRAAVSRARRIIHWRLPAGARARSRRLPGAGRH